MAEKQLNKDKVEYKERHVNERAIARYRKDEVLSILLDNSLIFQTNKSRIDLKLIDCGNYKQVYYFNKPHIKKDDNLIEMKDCHKMCLPNFNSKENVKKVNEEIKLKKIENKNILRSRFEMQRLVKCNESEFKTFITFTFADNITSVDEANKKFNTWRTYIKRLKKNFKCIGVPEFQKRGAIHYHLLTNISYDDFDLLSEKEFKYWNKETKEYQIGRHVKGWKYGIHLAKNMTDINVIGYLSKYMTKDIDNRLWGKRRYFYTRNLKKPVVLELNLSDIKDFQLYVDLLSDDFDISYSNRYIDFLNREVNYIEYKKN